MRSRAFCGGTCGKDVRTARSTADSIPDCSLLGRLAGPLEPQRWRCGTRIVLREREAGIVRQVGVSRTVGRHSKARSAFDHRCDIEAGHRGIGADSRSKEAMAWYLVHSVGMRKPGVGSDGVRCSSSAPPHWIRRHFSIQEIKQYGARLLRQWERSIRVVGPRSRAIRQGGGGRALLYRNSNRSVSVGARAASLKWVVANDERAGPA